MTITIWIGIAAAVAGLALVRRALHRRDPEEPAQLGSVSQGWVSEHRLGRGDDGLR